MQLNPNTPWLNLSNDRTLHKNSFNMDKEKIIQKAMKDSANDHFDPPHNFIGGGWLNNYTPQQIADQKLYKEVWQANRENIRKQR